MFGTLAGYLPKDSKYVAFWLSDMVEKAKAEKYERFQPSIEEMKIFLDENPDLKKEVEEMIAQGLIVHKEFEPTVKYSIASIDDMLKTLNYIITRAPEYLPEVSHSAFPVSGLFVYMMYTKAGARVFINKQFNEKLTVILNAWCKYLDSDKSLNVITTDKTGWLCPESYVSSNLDQFVTEQDKKDDPVHWGFTSFNDFFHRQIIPICRPLDGRGNDLVITSANDGTVCRLARNVKKEDEFYIKSQSYSLIKMLDNSEYVDRFVGGDVLQTFLSGHDYHRWLSPISGTIREQRVVPGYMFSELRSEGFDPSAGTKSQVYEANVNTRGLVFIESDNKKIGMVCAIPIGITEISSVNIQVKVGDKVKKGDELGWFSYGGSSMCLVFQPGAIAQFTVPNPLPGSSPDNGPFVRAKAQIAIVSSE